MALDDQLKVVNASGFLFQLRIEEVARASLAKTCWEVFAAEHPWTMANGDRGGFLDLILRQYSMRIVIECKRVREGKWIFLVPDVDRAPQQVNRLLWTHRQEGKRELSGYHQFRIEPKTLAASYCVVQGSGENDAPMLERFAGGLLAATDALAAQELAAGTASDTATTVSTFL